MTRSESINELATALAAAQGAIQHAKKDSENPHFRSKYADLAAVWEACRGALTAQGLSVVQSPRLVSGGEAVWLVEVETTLLHASGQFVSDVLAVPVSPASAQAVGSAITYARRYALAALVGVAPAGDDDDGDRAEPMAPPRPTKAAAKSPLPAKIPDKPGMVTAKVLGVVQRPMTDGRVKFIVSLDDQKTYHSLKLEDATIAKDAQSAGRPVALAYRVTEAGRVIESIGEAEVTPI